MSHLYCSTNFIEAIKPRKMSWTGHVVCMRERGGASYRVLLEKPEGKRPLGKPRCRWEDNIQMYHQEVRYGGLNWIEVSKVRDW